MFNLPGLSSLSGGGGIGGDTSSARSGNATVGGLNFSPGAAGGNSWLLPAAILAGVLVLALVLRKR